MKNVLDHDHSVSSSTTPARLSNASLSYRILYLLTLLLIVLATSTGIGLLLDDVAPHLFAGLSHAPISAAPLLLIGAASLGFQILIRPTLLDLFRALLVSSAFILWGIDQMLSAGWVATLIGDIVITLYVIDLAWMMLDRLKQTKYRSTVQIPLK